MQSSKYSEEVMLGCHVNRERWELASHSVWLCGRKYFQKGKIRTATAELWQEALAREKNREGQLDVKLQGPERSHTFRDQEADQDVKDEEKKVYSRLGDGMTQVHLPQGQKETPC